MLNKVLIQNIRLKTKLQNAQNDEKLVMRKKCRPTSTHLNKITTTLE